MRAIPLLAIATAGCAESAVGAAVAADPVLAGLRVMAQSTGEGRL